MPADLDRAREALEKAARELHRAAKRWWMARSDASVNARAHEYWEADRALHRAADDYARAARAAEGGEGEK